MMVPKMGMRLKSVAMVARRKANFTPKSTSPTRVSVPFTRQMVSCPRTTPANERSMRSARPWTSENHSGGTSVQT
jgi:hypothetical protein